MVKLFPVSHTLFGRATNLLRCTYSMSWNLLYGKHYDSNEQDRAGLTLSELEVSNRNYP